MLSVVAHPGATPTVLVSTIENVGTGTTQPALAGTANKIDKAPDSIHPRNCIGFSSVCRAPRNIL
jgi:hypothetical protein